MVFSVLGISTNMIFMSKNYIRELMQTDYHSILEGSYENLFSLRVKFNKMNIICQDNLYNLEDHLGAVACEIYMTTMYHKLN